VLTRGGIGYSAGLTELRAGEGKLKMANTKKTARTTLPPGIGKVQAVLFILELARPALLIATQPSYFRLGKMRFSFDKSAIRT
jgi:hypothetical protein